MEFIIDRPLAAIQRQLSWVSYAPVNWRGLVQSFSWGICAFESYLIVRQYPLYSKPAPPDVLKAHFDQETFEKSQRYGRDKAQFALVSGIYRQCVESALLAFDFYPWAWTAGGKFVAKVGWGGETLQSIAFVGLLYFGSAIPSLPLEWYKTFVLEEKHGFNKTTPGLFVADTLKGWAVGLAIGAPFLAGFLRIFTWAGDRFVPWLMGFMIAFQMSMVVLYPTVIQPLFNKLSPLREGELRTRTEALAGRLKFPLKHLYEIDGSKRSSHSNAYFFGLPWAKHIVIFDTLITSSSPSEVEAVLAHELGHWYFAHPTKMLAASQAHLLGVLAAFPAFLRAPPVLASFGFAKHVAARPPTIVAFLLFQMILTPLEAVVGALMNALTRKFEYSADEFALGLRGRIAQTAPETSEAALSELDDMGDRLGRALVTLHVKNLSTVWVDWLYSAYHHSHPTLTERLRALEVKGALQGKRVL